MFLRVIIQVTFSFTHTFCMLKYCTRSSAGADKLARRVWDQARSTDMVPLRVHCGLSLHDTTRDSVGLPVSYFILAASSVL